MSLKHLMLLTSSLATAGMAFIPLEAQADGANHAGAWGKPIDNRAGAGLAGLDCQMPQVQRPQSVGPVAVPQVGNFGNRTNGGNSSINVARPFSGQTDDESNSRARSRGMDLNVQRPTGVNRNFGGGDNVNSGNVNAYRPNSSNLNVTTPG